MFSGEPCRSGTEVPLILIVLRAIVTLLKETPKGQYQCSPYSLINLIGFPNASIIIASFGLISKNPQHKGNNKIVAKKFKRTIKNVSQQSSP